MVVTRPMFQTLSSSFQTAAEVVGKVVRARRANRGAKRERCPVANGVEDVEHGWSFKSSSLGDLMV